MGSPPRRMHGLLSSSLSPEVTSYSSKHRFRRIDKTARPESIGPHSGLYRKLQLQDREKKMNNANIGNSSSSKVVKFRKVKIGEPLSPLRNSQNDVNDAASSFGNDDSSSMFSMTTSGKELRARNSPYLKHMDEVDREEMLMELGSITISSIAEVNAEMKLRMMLAEVEQTHAPPNTRLRTHRMTTTTSTTSKTVGRDRRDNNNNNNDNNNNDNNNSSRNTNRNRNHMNKNMNMTNDTSLSLTQQSLSQNTQQQQQQREGKTDGNPNPRPDDGSWMHEYYEGYDMNGLLISDEPVGPFVDLSPSVSTASSNRSWHEESQGSPSPLHMGLGDDI